MAASILALADSFLIIGLIYLEHDRSIRPSKLLSTYLFVSALVGLVQARSLLIQRPATPTQIGAAFVALLATKLVLVLLEELPKRGASKAPSKEEISGPLNRSVFGWLNPLFFRGARNILHVDDLGSIDGKFDSARLLSALGSVWDACDKTAKHALLTSTLSAYRAGYLAPVIPRLCLAAFSFSQPFLIKRIIEFVGESKHGLSNDVAGGLIGATVLVYLGLAVSVK